MSDKQFSIRVTVGGNIDKDKKFFEYEISLGQKEALKFVDRNIQLLAEFADKELKPLREKVEKGPGKGGKLIVKNVRLDLK